MSDKKEVVLNDELFKNIKTEMTGRMILENSNGTDYDKGWREGFNEAMAWAINCLNTYKKGKGLFQIDK